MDCQTNQFNKALKMLGIFIGWIRDDEASIYTFLNNELVQTMTYVHGFKLARLLGLTVLPLRVITYCPC